MNDGDDDDENDRDGRAARNLFRTDSDSSSSIDDEDGDNFSKEEFKGEPPVGTLVSKQLTKETEILRVLNVNVEVQTVGGSIEHRLWPAAEYLATFILQNTTTTTSSSQQQQQSNHTNQEPTRFRDSNRGTKGSMERMDPTVSGASEKKRMMLAFHQLLRHAAPSKWEHVTTTTTTGPATNTVAAERIETPSEPPTTPTTLRVMELGAGVGLTGLALAAASGRHLHLHLHLETVLLTDLPSALPLLRRNVARNRDEFRATTTIDANTTNPFSNVAVQALAWGNVADLEAAIQWCRSSSSSTGENANHALDASTEFLIDQKHQHHPSSSPIHYPHPHPLLLLGSDCVYWESLYEPLVATIATLLRASPPSSMALLAGMRRWKRDTQFYQRFLPHASRTAHGQLRCVCLHEQVSRRSEKNDSGENRKDPPQRRRRQVMRIYAVQWVPYPPSRTERRG